MSMQNLTPILLGITLISMLISLLCWPQHGVIARWRRARQTAERMQREDAIKHIYLAEIEGRRPTVASVAGALYLRRSATVALLARMQAAGLIQYSTGDISLTPRGRQGAIYLVRAHRLWEHHLAEETGLGELDWHQQADVQEHFLSREETDRLAARLGNPGYDPHGDPIPTATGELVTPPSQALTALAPGQSARITHLEDEPAAVYAQLVAEGLHPGMIIRVGEASAEQLSFWSNTGEHLLAPVVAANIFVTPLPSEAAAATEPVSTLADLHLDEAADVIRISPRCRGIERRRLLDLGIVPGTHIVAELASPSGKLTAYRVRGALIALRDEQAALIQVNNIKHEPPN